MNLLNEPEIFDYDKKKGQVLDADDYVQNAHLAIGFASRCWKKKHWWSKEVFDTEEALRLVNELCAYMRLLKEGKAH